MITEAGGTTASTVEGDYFRIDSGNDFATGNRLVRPSDFCRLQEARIVDFGSGTQFRILIDLPRGSDRQSFTYKAYDFPGNLTYSGVYFTSDHLTVITAAELGISQVFGTVLFDFSDSFGGWVSSRYSAFDRFSVEIPAACRD